MSPQTLQSYLGDFKNSHAAHLQTQVKSQTWLKRLKEEAMERFCATGFPTTKWENWRHTDLSSLEKQGYLRPKIWDGHFTTPSPFERKAAGLRVVFVDGIFSPSFSTLDGLPTGVTIRNLESLLRTNPEKIEHFINTKGFASRSGTMGKNEMSLVDLNTAFLEDGLYLHIARDKVLDQPIQVVYLSTQREEKAASYPRTFIVAESNSNVTVIERYLGWKNNNNNENLSYFTNAVTQIFADEGARVEHVRLQEEARECIHLSDTEVFQRKDSSVKSFSISLGGALVRNEIRSRLDGEGAETDLRGLFFGTGIQHVDHFTEVDHACPNTKSNEYYKGLLAEKSRGVFMGLIRVRPGADKTDARQLNRNVLLSEGAIVNTKPQLEILADDVKCSHGATVGQIDKDALFYLRSRGIEEQQAKAILLSGFVGEIVDEIASPRAREKVALLVNRWLAERSGA